VSKLKFDTNSFVYSVNIHRLQETPVLGGRIFITVFMFTESQNNLSVEMQGRKVIEIFSVNCFFPPLICFPVTTCQIKQTKHNLAFCFDDFRDAFKKWHLFNKSFFT